MSRQLRTAPIQRWSAALTAAAAAVIALWYVVGIRYITVDTDSMAPSLGAGSHAVVAPLDRDVERDEIVVFDPPQTWVAAYQESRMRYDGPDRLHRMVKRVLAVAGDELICCDPGGQLVRNGERLDEDYLLVPTGKANNPAFRIVVPDGKVWLMGDNRPVSFDSRAVAAWGGDGFVSVDDLRYRIVLHW